MLNSTMCSKIVYRLTLWSYALNKGNIGHFCTFLSIIFFSSIFLFLVYLYLTNFENRLQPFCHNYYYCGVRKNYAYSIYIFKSK